MRVFGAFVFYSLTLVFVWLGFDKIMNYRNSDYGENVNAYVGGDAYNYMINSNYFGAYFTLALVCAVIGSTIVIVGKLDQFRVAVVGGSDALVAVVGQSDGSV